jgi:hypothetical protein
LELTSSFDLEWKECPICMEEFHVNDIVSWSPDNQTSCQHFFHHECIKGKRHCPFHPKNNFQSQKREREEEYNK